MPEGYRQMKWCVPWENYDHAGNKVVSFYSNALQKVKRVMHKAKAGRMSKVWKHQAISEWSICMHWKYRWVENSNPSANQGIFTSNNWSLQGCCIPFPPSLGKIHPVSLLPIYLQNVKHKAHITILGAYSSACWNKWTFCEQVHFFFGR